LIVVPDLATIRDKEKSTLIPLRIDPTNSGNPIPIAPDEPSWLTALRAAESKKATHCTVLDLREITSLADYFLICTATNQRQAQAIWDEIAKQSKTLRGDAASGVEGYSTAEWICGDFGDLIVHIFTPEKREYYDLERLWRHAKHVALPERPRPAHSEPAIAEPDEPEPEATL
jgi:ribosome-associated protein